MSRYLSAIKSYTTALPQFVAPTVISLLTFGILARILTAKELGIYGLMVSTVYLVGLSANFGLKRAVIVEISRDKEGWRYAKGAIKLTIIFTLAAAGITAGIYYYFKIFDGLIYSGPTYLAFTLLLTLFALRNFISFPLEALKKFHLPSLYTTVGFIIYRILMVAAVISGLSLLGIILSWALGEGIAIAGIAREVARFRASTANSLRISQMGDLLGKARHIFLFDITMSLVEYGDRIVTTLFGFYLLANFYIASTGAQAVGALAQALYSGLLPHLSEELRRSRREEFMGYVQRLSKYFTLFLSPIYIVSAVLAYPLIILLAGSGYQVAIPLFQIIVITLGITVILPLVANILIASDHPRDLMIAQIIGFIVDIIILIGLYPYIGYLSAGFGKAFLYVTTLSISLYLLHKRLGIIPYRLVDIGKILIANIVTMVLTWILWILTFRLTLLPLYITFSILAYMILLRQMRIIDAEDIRILFSEIPLKGKPRDMIFKLITRLTGVKTDLETEKGGNHGENPPNNNLEDSRERQ